LVGGGLPEDATGDDAKRIVFVLDNVGRPWRGIVVSVDETVVVLEDRVAVLLPAWAPASGRPFVCGVLPSPRVCGGDVVCLEDGARVRCRRPAPRHPPTIALALSTIEELDILIQARTLPRSTSPPARSMLRQLIQSMLRQLDSSANDRRAIDRGSNKCGYKVSAPFTSKQTK